MNNQKFLKYSINIKQISYSLDGSNPIRAVIDLNSIIQYSSNDFVKYFNNGEAAFAKSIFTLKIFQANWTEIELILIQTVIFQKPSKIIIFIKDRGIIYPYIIEFLPIVNPTTKQMAGISMIARQYEEHSLLFHRLKQKSFTMGSKVSKMGINYTNLSTKLTQFQMTICYLVVHNYPNERIAEIINLIDESRSVKKTSRSAINKQIVKIREALLLNSKNEIIDFLIEIKFHNYLPSTIFNETVIVLD